jgi:hypothetical protein
MGKKKSATESPQDAADPALDVPDLGGWEDELETAPDILAGRAREDRDPTAK